MRNFVWLAMALCVWLPFQTAHSQDECGKKVKTLRIMTYNVRDGKGLDGVTDYGRVADVINKVAPDVVAIQELDSVTNRSGQRDVLHELSDKTLMYRIYAPAIDYDGGKYGIGMLSKEKPLNYHYISLPGREEQRALLVAEFADYVFCCTHLSLTPEDQLLSLPLIRKEVQAYEKPVFVAGDFNAVDGSALINGLKKDFVLLSDPKQPTFPADKPDSCLDHIVAFKQPGEVPYTLLGRRVVNNGVASDHRPVVVDLRLKAKAADIFRTKPYLQKPVDNGITVMWNTNVPSYSWVEYGTDKNRLDKKQPLVDGQVICNNYLHKVRLENLTPGVTYYYRVCSREITLYQAYKKEFGETAVSDFYTFKLPALQDKDFTALIFNDLHKQNATLKALCEQVQDIPYDFVIFNGDCVDDPRNEEEAIGFLSAMNEQVGADHVPVFYLRGNHEIRNAYSIGLRKLFDYVGDKTYGAFSWGDTRFVVLDCGEDKPDDHWVYYGLNDFTGLRNDQIGFLKNELASKAFRKASKRVLVHHVPIYGETDEYNPCLQLWGSLLAKAPFDVSINAHIHRYSYHPKGKAGNNFPVVIGGGYSLKSATVMILQKKGKEMTLRVMNANGETIDEMKL